MSLVEKDVETSGTTDSSGSPQIENGAAQLQLFSLMIKELLGPLAFPLAKVYCCVVILTDPRRSLARRPLLTDCLPLFLFHHSSYMTVEGASSEGLPDMCVSLRRWML